MNQNTKLDNNLNKAAETAPVRNKHMPVTTTIHALTHDGRGIATIDKKTTFITGTLIGETVSCKITHRRSTYNEAELLEVITPSENRQTPPCAHFGVCGGCSLQHMGLAEQATLKQQTLIDQLKHFGQVVPERILEPLSASATGYRRKGRLGAKYVIKKEKMMVGFREKASRYLADIDLCPVLHPRVGEQLIALREMLFSLQTYDQIPQVEIAVGDTDVALLFRHMVPMPDSDKALLIAFGQQQDMHIYLQPNQPDPAHKIWPTDGIERLTYTLPDENLEFLFHPLDFTQINLEMNRLMVRQSIELLELKPTDRVLDLFCGIGNFSLPIARHADHVTGVEGSDEMVIRANANAAHNQISNTEFYAANLMDPALKAPWLNEQFDKILLDPPRAGAKELLPLLAPLNAKRIVYVSCNPATLARDAGELVHKHGYRLIEAGIMNMFPHTAHIESIAVFEKITAKK